MNVLLHGVLLERKRISHAIDSRSKSATGVCTKTTVNMRGDCQLLCQQMLFRIVYVRTFHEKRAYGRV